MQKRVFLNSYNRKEEEEMTKKELNTKLRDKKGDPEKGDVLKERRVKKMIDLEILK